MPVTRRQTAAARLAALPQATPTDQAFAKDSSPLTDLDEELVPFEKAFRQGKSDNETTDNDDKDTTYNSRAKATTANKKRKLTNTTWHKNKKHPYGPAPKVPEMSDEEDEGSSNELYIKKPKEDARNKTLSTPERPTNPHVLKITVESTPGHSTTINLNLADIFQQYKSGKSSFHVTTNAFKALKDSTNLKPTTSFLSLPYEIRVRIYRQVFVVDSPILFTDACFNYTSALLRTCRQIEDEGTDILYGENSFHFARSHESRGRFFEGPRRDVGFKDIRRFLETIGSGNISKLCYVTLMLEDAPPSSTPLSSSTERRFVNDAVLHRILDLIGKNTTLYKFGVMFAGRGSVQISDFHFLKFLSNINCNEFVHIIERWPYTSRVQDGVIDKLTKYMLVPKDDDACTSKVKMYYDIPTAHCWRTNPNVKEYKP